jgi:tRNA pseudouridine(55) synthase
MIEAYKKIGQTPLQLLDKLREEDPNLSNEILSYAGRLDPIAEGKMMILVGKKENRRREKYLHYDKTYEAHVLFGFSTDTLDIMGMVTNHTNGDDDINSTDLHRVLEKIRNLRIIDYPNYSSKTVRGKALFQWEREGRTNEITIPQRAIKVKRIMLLETLELSGVDLWDYLETTIRKVTGDFRQKQILTKWQNTLTSINNDFSKFKFKVAKIKFRVSGGTYIRSLVNEISKEMQLPITLLKLKRTKIHKKFIIF